MTLFIYIFVSVFGLLAALFLISFASSYWRLLAGEAPFVPVSGEAVPEIVKTLGIKNNSVVYDLGCGDGRVLLAAHELEPEATYVGIEKSFPIFLCAWIRTKKIKKPHRVKIRKKDFFREDISKATHVFTYLMPKMMKELTPKFQKELAPGTRVVSCDFPIRSKEPSRVVKLESEGQSPLCKLYVYDF